MLHVRPQDRVRPLSYESFISAVSFSDIVMQNAGVIYYFLENALLTVLKFSLKALLSALRRGRKLF